MKISITVENLCEGLPKQFIDYFNYVKKLEFTSTPDYDYLNNLI